LASYKTKILLVIQYSESALDLALLMEAPDTVAIRASSCHDAVALLSEHRFALALIDAQAPLGGGLALAALLRGNSRTEAVPFIFTNATQTSLADIATGYEHGAADYLLEPFEPLITYKRIRVFVELDQKTQALQQQQLLEIANLKITAEAARLAKSRFLANVSHELRTPLGAAIGFSELLATSGSRLNEADHNCLAAITRNSRLALSLIDDIIDLAKLETEQVDLDIASVDLRQLLLDLQAVYVHRAEDKGIAFAIKLPGPLPRMICTDQRRLRQVLNSLLSNAIKFTNQGQVELSVALKQGSSVSLEFTVKDSGCGLMAAEIAQIFQPFIQADSSTTRRFGGTGLGLVIAQRLAQLMGGDVVVRESLIDVGSTFTATINPGLLDHADQFASHSFLSDVDAKLLKTPASPLRLDGLSILVVDDTNDNRLLLRRLLEQRGAKVDSANDGFQAVEMALANSYDVILMDLQMPGLDGYGATAQLRSRGYVRPVIAVTAHAMGDELDRCLKVGFDHYLKKPVQHPQLAQTIITARNNAAYPPALQGWDL